MSDQGTRQPQPGPLGARQAAVRRLQLAAVRVPPAMYAAVHRVSVPARQARGTVTAGALSRAPGPPGLTCSAACRRLAR